MSNVTATASGASNVNYAVAAIYSGVVMNNVTLAAPGQGMGNAGIFYLGVTPNVLKIANSSITSGGYALLIDQWYATEATIDATTLKGEWSIGNPGSLPIFIGASKLVGPLTGTGAVCVASYNGNYAPLDASCQ